MSDQLYLAKAINAGRAVSYEDQIMRTDLQHQRAAVRRERVRRLLGR